MLNLRHNLRKIKKDAEYLKSNYRPIDIIPSVSEINEMRVYDQLVNRFDRSFSKYQSCFRDGFSIQQCLGLMLSCLH